METCKSKYYYFVNAASSVLLVVISTTLCDYLKLFDKLLDLGMCAFYTIYLLLFIASIWSVYYYDTEKINNKICGFFLGLFSLFSVGLLASLSSSIVANQEEGNSLICIFFTLISVIGFLAFTQQFKNKISNKGENDENR